MTVYSFMMLLLFCWRSHCDRAELPRWQTHSSWLGKEIPQIASDLHMNATIYFTKSHSQSADLAGIDFWAGALQEGIIGAWRFPCVV